MFSLRVIAHITTQYNTLANVIKPNELLCSGWSWMETHREWNLWGAGDGTSRWKRRHGGVKEKIDKQAASSLMTTHKMNLAGCCNRPHSPTNTFLLFLRMKEVSVAISVHRREKRAFKSMMTRKMQLLITKVYALHPEAKHHVQYRHQHIQFTPEIISYLTKVF